MPPDSAMAWRRIEKCSRRTSSATSAESRCDRSVDPTMSVNRMATFSVVIDVLSLPTHPSVGDATMGRQGSMRITRGRARCPLTINRYRRLQGVPDPREGVPPFGCVTTGSCPTLACQSGIHASLGVRLNALRFKNSLGVSSVWCASDSTCRKMRLDAYQDYEAERSVGDIPQASGTKRKDSR